MSVTNGITKFVFANDTILIDFAEYTSILTNIVTLCDASEICVIPIPFHSVARIAKSLKVGWIV